MKGLFWTPFLIDLISLFLIWEFAKFVWTGRTQFGIQLGKENIAVVIQKGESYEKDKEEFYQKTKNSAPFGQAHQSFVHHEGYNNLRKAGR